MSTSTSVLLVLLRNLRPRVSECAKSPLTLEFVSICLEGAQLFHEAFVRLCVLPLRFTELKRVLHAQAEAAHGVHYEGCRTAALAHRTVNQYTVLVLGARCGIYRGIVPLNATVVLLLLVHVNIRLVAREIDFQSGGRIGVVHL